MKANEAPDKIYVSTNINGEVFDNSWFWHNLHHSDIEYTRTDAFVEKAAKYLYEYNQNMVKKYGAKAVLSCSEFTINVEDFKKYMKGE